MPQRQKAAILVGSVVTGLLLVALTVVVATLGGFLNHCRGGYVHFGPLNTTSNSWYWSQHTLGRLLFALPTGLAVIVFGLHLKASLVVTILTWFSLFAGWGSYMNIGVDDSFCSRVGAFDWLVGMQPYNFSANQRFVREYSGMSLRGLLWTLPQGYALEQFGFGWEYSLTGTVMPLLYYIGANTNTTHVHGHRMRQFVSGGLAVSELMWGLWLWFVLIVSCVSQCVRRVRIWIHQRYPNLGAFSPPFDTFEKVKYESMNRSVLRILYDSFVTVLTVLYMFTTIYYSVVVQKDMRNKGQTFFGVFTGVIFLVVMQAWLWGIRYKTFLRKRYARLLRGRTRTNNAIYNGSIQVSVDGDPELARTTCLADNELEHCNGRIRANSTTSSTASYSGGHSSRRERRPVLSWPYSHPDRLSPTEEQRQQVLDMSEHLNPRLSSSRYNLIALWARIEEIMWLDVFIYTRRFVGVVTLVCTIFSILITLTATIIGWNSPRFTDDLIPPCYELNDHDTMLNSL